MQINKVEYLRQLAQKLSALPKNERQDALEYYDGYLSDAEDEQEAITQLGSPGEVASDILADYMSQKPIQGYANFKTRKQGAKVAWAFLIGIFALPIGLPLLIGVIAVAFSLFITLGAVIVAFGASALTVAVVGVGSMIVSPFIMIQSFSGGLLALGHGLVSLGIGILLFKLCNVLIGGFTFIGRATGKKISRRKNSNGKLTNS